MTDELVAPADLVGDALEVWRTVVPELESLGLVGPVDVELLRAWCSSVAELRACEAWVAEHGTVLTVRDDKGNVRTMSDAPKYRQARALRADLVKLAGELGLSPRARAALPDTGKAGEADPLDDLATRRAARFADAAGS